MNEKKKNAAGVTPQAAAAEERAGKLEACNRRPRTAEVQDRCKMGARWSTAVASQGSRAQAAHRVLRFWTMMVGMGEDAGAVAASRAAAPRTAAARGGGKRAAASWPPGPEPSCSP